MGPLVNAVQQITLTYLQSVLRRAWAAWSAEGVEMKGGEVAYHYDTLSAILSLRCITTYASSVNS